MEPAFLAAIAADPQSDLPRLVFADWLDERGELGDAERAEFIRLSVAEPRRTFWPHDDTPLGRAAELAATHWRHWLGLRHARPTRAQLDRWLSQGDCRWGYRRGCVAEVWADGCDAAAEFLGGLLRHEPVEAVTITAGDFDDFAGLAGVGPRALRPTLRAVELNTVVLTPAMVDRVRDSADWLRRVERVEVRARFARSLSPLRLWLWRRGNPALRHVVWRTGMHAFE